MQLLLVLTSLLCLLACGGGDGHAHDHDHADHDHDHGIANEPHVHVAPRGGLLLTLAEEQAHVEVLHDPTTGTLSLYLLGPHADQPVRSTQGQVEVSLSQPATLRPLTLAGVASPLTGETQADTSHFRVVDPSLKGGRIAGSIVSLEHRGTTYTGVAFELPEDEGDQ